MKIRKIIPLLMTFQMLCSASIAQSQEKIYALFLMNFVKGINWTDAKGSNFIIDVLSYAPLQTELDAVSKNIKVNGKKIEVRLINDLSESSGQILFVPAFKSKIISAAVLKENVVVSNSPNLARKGGAYNFVLTDGRLSYEINVKSLESRGLKVSTGLKASGVVVE